MVFIPRFRWSLFIFCLVLVLLLNYWCFWLKLSLARDVLFSFPPFFTLNKIKLFFLQREKDSEGKLATYKVSAVIEETFSSSGSERLVKSTVWCLSHHRLTLLLFVKVQHDCSEHAPVAGSLTLRNIDVQLYYDLLPLFMNTLFLLQELA